MLAEAARDHLRNTQASTLNLARVVKRGGNGSFPTFHPLLALAWTTHIFKLDHHFDLNCTPVTFSECILHGCDAIAVTKSVHRHMNTWQSTQKRFFGSSGYRSQLSSSLQDHILPWWVTQTHKVKTMPASLSQLVIRIHPLRTMNFSLNWISELTISLTLPSLESCH